MKTTLIFATNNPHKTDEIRKVVGNRFQIITLKEAGIDIEIPEPHDTLEANASEKSNTIHLLSGQNCFSEDTGLEVVSLNGEPGVNSARYAGESRDFQMNIDRLLMKMLGIENRKARFRTVVSLILEGKEFLFEGICEGDILLQPKGTGGFGYDSVFVPTGAGMSFAEMTMDEKNKYSHRKKAISQLLDFLQIQKP